MADGWRVVLAARRTHMLAALADDTVWTVLNELQDPPVRNADGMAVDLITRLYPHIRPRYVRVVLDEWREYARLAVEDDWD